MCGQGRCGEDGAGWVSTAKRLILAPSQSLGIWSQVSWADSPAVVLWRIGSCRGVRKGAPRAAHAKHWSIAEQGRPSCPSAGTRDLVQTPGQVRYPSRATGVAQSRTKQMAAVRGWKTERARGRGRGQSPREKVAEISTAKHGETNLRNHSIETP
jgi:hypothetical protein